MKRYLCDGIVKGATHQRNGLPCQDSKKIVEISDDIVMIAVADGHGSEKCPRSDSMETAVESVSYGSTQTCFLMNNNGTYEVGLASYCYGYDVGEETPAVRTYAEVYSVAGDGSVSLCASGSVQNGEGQDGFSASLVPAGMSGSWNSSNAETLQSMGYADDP